MFDSPLRHQHQKALVARALPFLGVPIAYGLQVEMLWCKVFAIPFGPTPVSVADECRLVTRVNRVGALTGDPACLATVDEGDRVILEPEPD